jgi:hypothetical protein
VNNKEIYTETTSKVGFRQRENIQDAAKRLGVSPQKAHIDWMQLDLAD